MEYALDLKKHLNFMDRQSQEYDESLEAMEKFCIDKWDKFL